MSDGSVSKPLSGLGRWGRVTWSRFRNWRSWSLLWKMLAIAIAVHILIGLLTIPGLFFGGGESLEDRYARGQDLMKNGRYAEAMDVFQQILDEQPKPATIFTRAAQQHQLAEKLSKQPIETPATAPAPAAAATPMAAPAASDSPAAPVAPPVLPIPPELRQK